MKTILFLLLLIPSISIRDIHAQCMLHELSLNEKTKGAALIIEGKVIDKCSFWNDTHTKIFTSNKLEIYKVFQGKLNRSEIELITEGGTIGLSRQTILPVLELQTGDAGIFFLTNGVSLNEYNAYGGIQGFIQYDKELKSASDPFRKYKTIDDLYTTLSLSAGQYTELKKLTESKNSDIGTKQSMVINSFSPSSIAAGTEAQLTINGSGFGNAQGATAYVEFRDANSGGMSYFTPEASQYISWSDNQIIVNVPFKAGSGTFRIKNGSSTLVSPTSLTVTYSHLNVTSGGNVYHTNLIDKDSNGGYLWKMSTDFNNNTPAKEAFNRAFVAWRCETFIKWELGDVTTTNNTASDGINIIRFDSGSELPPGVLGSCYIYWSGCSSGSGITWYVNELDIVFNDATNWNYSTSPPLTNQYDFESVVLHELGHGHQLGHIINSSGVMHYSIGAGQSKRALSTNDIIGGNHVMSRSKSSISCGNPAMVAFNSSNCSGTIAVASVSIELSSGKNPDCEGIPLTYTASATYGGSSPTYQWIINGNKVGTNSSTFTTSTLQNGEKVSCVMSSSIPGVTGSPATSNEINMSIHPKSPLPEVITTGQDSLTSSVSGIIYHWYFNGAPLPDSIKTIKPLLTGNYGIRVTDHNGCVSDISPDYFYSPLSLNKKGGRLPVIIYPNPSQGLFRFEMDSIYESFTEITVCDHLGQEVYKNRDSKTFRKEINLNDCSNGIYFVSIKAKDKKTVLKIILIK